ncbi:MAG TPA: hypothetical protein VEZ11_09525 [Thermoanaerobaculia bacterium]|nr:hypothetical protein [Thermoanaerobaculia bacterium]
MTAAWRARLALIALITVWAIATLLWLQPGVTRPDGAGYFVYLPSTWLDHDLLFFNEWQTFGMIDHGIIRFKGITPTGHLGNHWTSGSSVLWYPAYVAGDAMRRLVPALRRYPPNGISLPYSVAVIVSSAFAGLLALLAGFTAARARYGEGAALLAATGVWLGSPLAWYSLRHSLMAHAVSAAISSLVVLLALRLRDRADAGRLFAFGLAIGIAFAVRPQNLPLALLPLILAETSNRWPLVRRAAYAVAGFLIGALPQIVVGYVLDGNPLGFASVGGVDPGRPWRAFERIWVWEPLLSWFHGMIPWTPFLLIAIAGFFVLLHDDRRLGLAAIYAFVAQWIINAAFERSFWGGVAFGQRRFDSCTIFFILGAAALFKRIPRWLAIAMTLVTCAWTMSLFFAAGSLDLNRYQTPSELWAAQVAAVMHPPPLAALTFVRPDARADVMIVGLAALVVLGGIACLVALALKYGGARSVTTAAAVYLAGIAAFYAWCGSNDAARLPRYKDVIALNRDLGPVAGGAANRLELLEEEELYLRKSGRLAAAEDTKREIEALQKLRDESLRRMTR